MRVKGLGYVGVESPQYKEWEELGPEVFAMGLAEPGRDGSCRLRLDDRHHRITVHPGERNRLRYLGWEVASEAEFDEAVEQLRVAGVEPTIAPDADHEDRRVERLVTCLAPSGLRHEIFWSQEERHRSFQPGRPCGGFVTGDQGLGHVVVFVPDAERERAFVTDGLGCRLTDIVRHPERTTYFFRVNRRHHSIAFNTKPGRRGLHHILVQAKELDDVGIALDRAMARGLPITSTLGRHSTDRMLSFYVRTPSGFDIEYGYGALEVDDDEWSVVTTLHPAEVWGHHHPPLPPELAADAAVEDIDGF